MHARYGKLHDVAFEGMHVFDRLWIYRILELSRDVKGFTGENLRNLVVAAS